MLTYIQKEKEKIDSLSPYNSAGILQILPYLIPTCILIPIIEMREIRLREISPWSYRQQIVTGVHSMAAHSREWSLFFLLVVVLLLL